MKKGKNLFIVCFVAIVAFGFASCKPSKPILPTPPATVPPTDAEIKALCYKNIAAMLDLDLTPRQAQAIDEDTAEKMIAVTDIKRGEPTKGVKPSSTEEIDIFPIRITVKNLLAESMGIAALGEGGIDPNKADEKTRKAAEEKISKTHDFYFYKNDFKEWVFVPE